MGADRLDGVEAVVEIALELTKSNANRCCGRCGSCGPYGVAGRGVDVGKH